MWWYALFSVGFIMKYPETGFKNRTTNTPKSTYIHWTHAALCFSVSNAGLRLRFWHFKIENYFRFNFLFIFLTCVIMSMLSPEYAQSHKQLQKQLCDKCVLKIHHSWQVSFFWTAKVAQFMFLISPQMLSHCASYKNVAGNNVSSIYCKFYCSRSVRTQSVHTVLQLYCVYPHHESVIWLGRDWEALHLPFIRPICLPWCKHGLVIFRNILYKTARGDQNK